MTPTRLERYVAKRIADVLRADERLEASVYLFPLVPKGKKGLFGLMGVAHVSVNDRPIGFYGVLTNERLLLIETDLARWRPAALSYGLRSYELRELRGHVVGRELHIETNRGDNYRFKVPSPRQSSSHLTFFSHWG